MWYELYKYMGHLQRLIDKNPQEKHFTVEMDLDLYKFAREINFVSENGYINFRGKTFGLA